MQQLVAAKWSFEAGHTDAGLEALTSAVHEAQQLVSGLIRAAGMADHSEQVPRAVDTFEVLAEAP